MNLIFSFFDSSFFVALTTIFVGGIAIILYIAQKQDHKRDAAELIIQEIRYAEQLIKSARDIGYVYSFANKILPTNSWHSNINLFIKNLGETDIDTIGKFYSNAAYLDKVINYISDRLNKTLIPVPTGDSPPSEEEIEKIVNQKKLVLQPLATEILKDVSKKIDFIYNTPAVDKLRKIAKKKWYQL